MELQYLNGLGCGPDKLANHDYIDFEEDDLEGNWEGQAYNKRRTISNGMGRINLGTTSQAANCNCRVNNPEMDGLFQDIGNGISNVVKGAVNVVKDVGQKIADVATNVANAVADSVKLVASRIGTIAKEIVHTFANIFPATVIIRTAFLTAMKLNILNIARRLRWAYTPKDWFVSQQGGDPGKYDKLMKVKNRIEDIFYWAGGNIANVEEAIKTGKGNSKDSINWGAFSGFGSVDVVMDTRDLHPGMSLREILGEKMFNDEVSRGNLNGTTTSLGELGEPISATIASIMPVLTALTTLIGAIGSLKGGGAANPALTSDMDPGLTTAPENNLSDMEYANSYTNALNNSSTNLQSFSDVQAAIGTNTTSTIPGVRSTFSLINPVSTATNPPATQQNTANTTPVVQASYNETPAPAATDNTNNNNKTPAESWFKRNQTAILVTTGLAVAGTVTGIIIWQNRKKQRQKLLQSHRLNGPGRNKRPARQSRPGYNF